MNIHCIVNPRGARGQASGVAETARARLEQAGITLTTHISAYPGHAVKLAADLCAARAPGLGVDGILAAGGDGTLFEVMNGMMQGTRPSEGSAPSVLSSPSPSPSPPPLPIPVGVIPLGTGNSFARDLGITTLEESLQAVTEGRTRPVDLGTLSCSAGDYFFANLLGAGFVSNVAHGAARYKRLGAASYIISVLRETIALAPQRITLTVDGATLHREAHFVEVCNSRYTGGSMLMAPGARIDDGLLDVVLLRSVSRRKLLSLFPQIFSGTHVEDPCIEVIRGATLSVETERPWLLTPDGETFGSTPITAGVLPRHVEMFCR